MATKKTNSGAKRLVIVESPAKARTMSKFLGGDYSVKASMGHVRDLPSKTLGIDIANDFEPEYIPTKPDVIKDIKDAFNSKTDIYLATDPDREGEAIAWHIFESVKQKKANTVQRVVFHEITKNAVADAFKTPRAINADLVDAQQARRLLDRLVGYQLSEILWLKVRRGLSAGRVQSAALSLIVQREREIEAFVKEEYWNINAHLKKNGAGFSARLILPKKDTVRDEKTAAAVKAELTGAEFSVAAITSKEAARRPAPPFTTSTLQQEASRRFGMSARRTMTIAQQLYEGAGGSAGLITYMRTDSTNLSEAALSEIGKFIKTEFGAEYGGAPRRYKTRSANAQEAHEAIRPTQITRTPAAMKGALEPTHLKIYELIWKRAVASQMKNAVLEETVVDIDAESEKGKRRLQTRGAVLKFDGFRKLYSEQPKERAKSEDDADPVADNLPALKRGDKLTLAPKGVVADQKFTQPPPRYSEAMLIHAMEQNGIGRPSTYATIIHTIEQREYVAREQKRFAPTRLGKTVCGFLERNFPDILDIKFTAGMENELDAIARGEINRIKTLSEFYEPFKSKLSDARAVEHVPATEINEVSDQVCEKCGGPMLVKTSRRGNFLGCSKYPKCKNIVSLNAQSGENSAELEYAGENCEKCERPMVIRMGRYGRFVGCSGYPECRNMHALIEKTDIDCPKCGEGSLIKRESRRGPFYGCSAYPKCRFIIGNEPLSEPCPECGGLVYLHRDGKHQICYNTRECGWRGERAKDAPKSKA